MPYNTFMPNYKRLYAPGGTYFFTLVTAQRAPIFSDNANIDILRKVIAQIRKQRPFQIIAAVVLPDHLHTIWTLPAGDTDYSTRLAAIKAKFSHHYLAAGGLEQPITKNQSHQQRRGVWQPRFIEHTCRNESDLINHIEYIHYNPVKHGLVKRPVDWPHSSLHRFIRAGSVSPNWAVPGTDYTNPDNNVNAKLLE